CCHTACCHTACCHTACCHTACCHTACCHTACCHTAHASEPTIPLLASTLPASPTVTTTSTSAVANTSSSLVSLQSKETLPSAALQSPHQWLLCQVHSACSMPSRTVGTGFRI